ncbi:hypothetical protein SAMN02745126_00413 [Enhydrobacter aerosaccus]|uniref:Lipoprotein n=1 Tax=Enhydrobacter aerosaccus TaxID=225324 RepID=A0A1T4JSC3_9HYPH|nr:hypothetical protein [Enhydrobacter aerosaccus]SJZ33068.1 hypothetical protein SAMN02745126_00413 [Enhydrobacter aerosaccus]
MRTALCVAALAAVVATSAGCAERPYYYGPNYAYAPAYGYYSPGYSYGYSNAYPTRYYSSKWDYYRNYNGIHPPSENM